MSVRKFMAPFRVLGWRWHSVAHTEFICVFTSVNVFILSNWTQTHPVMWAWTYTVVSHKSHLNHLDCAYEETIKEKNEPFFSIFSHLSLLLSLSLFGLCAVSPAVCTNLIILALQLTLITLSCAVCVCMSTTS